MEISPSKALDVVRSGLVFALDKALDTAEPVASRHIESTRKNHDGITPAGVLRRLEWEYRLTATTTGGGAGLAAFAPNPVAWAATVGEVGVFITASAVLVVASAKVHGLDELDPLQRRVMVTGILLGNSGSGAIKEAAPKIAKHWAKHLVNGIPAAKLQAINKVLAPNFVTKYGTKQGVLVLGREAPLGIGAAIGGVGNAVFAEATIRTARKAFGPVRTNWD
jgi:hypothetical protein